MTSYRFEIGDRARKGGRLIGRVCTEITKAFSEENEERGLTQHELAQALELDSSQLSLQLSGKGLSLRALAELASALNREVSIELRRPADEPGQNAGPVTSTISHSPMKIISRANTSNEVCNPSPPKSD